MTKRDSFLLRLDPAVLEAVRHWADDEMRSMNAQIEFLLRKSLRETGRLPKPGSSSSPSENAQSNEKGELDREPKAER